jgi:hypothetical protein
MLDFIVNKIASPAKGGVAMTPNRVFQHAVKATGLQSPKSDRTRLRAKFFATRSKLSLGNFAASSLGGLRVLDVFFSL